MTASANNRGNGAGEYDSLPDEMRKALRWLLWRMEKNPDPTKKPRKVPYYADGGRRTGELESPADRARLASFDDALRALQTGSFTGLGFALGPDGSGNVWQGIDLDEIPSRPALSFLAEDLPGYTEDSPSGNGKHAIGYGRPFASLGSNATGIEAYARGRFFTVTAAGAGIHPPVCLADFVEQRLKPMHGSRSDEPTKTSAGEPAAIANMVHPQTVTELRSALLHMRADDRELWVRIGHALKTLGDVGRGLWLDWSATSSKFDPLADTKTWDSFKPKSIDHTSVFFEAQRAGWVNPASKAASLPTSVAGWTVVERKGFAFVQARDLLSKPKPIPWLIRGVFEQGALAELFGQSGCGKSFMAIDWGCCIATGTNWCGKDVEQGAVFYIAGEGHAGIGRRLRAWEIHNSKSLTDAPIFVSTAPAALMDGNSAMNVATAVEALIAEHGQPKLIIVDTLARNLGNGEENSNADIGMFINNIDVTLRSRFGATVLIVHHTGHLEKDRSRGASALRAAMDSEYRLDLAGAIRSLVCTKAKESEELPPMCFKLEQIVLDGWTDEEGELMTSAILVSSVETSKRKPKVLTGANRIAFDALNHAIAAHGDNSPDELKAAMGMLTPAKVISEDVWRQRCYDEGISDGEQDAKKKAFGRSRKTLLDLKKVSTWQGVYWPGSFCPDGLSGEGNSC